MIDRRTLFGATATVASAVGALFGSKSASAAPAPMSAFKGDIEPRGTNQRLERLPKLDLESYDNFLTGLRIWSGSASGRLARDRFTKAVTDAGLDPKDNIPPTKVFPLVEDDHIIGTGARLRTSGQQLMWKSMQLHYHENADAYLAEMEATDNVGPGKLELNPDMDIPNYTKYEIHMQPGGYVGDAFAGHMYHYGTNNFYRAENYQDEIHRGLASQMATPKDGKVMRILDMGCGTGQLTAALKERFPDAEVWGVDIGGPMVRYAHMRCVDLEIGANFRQGLAEETGFEDGYFDIVTSYILHHEVTAEKTKEIIDEAYRVLRPGGVYFPVDFQTGAGRGRRDNAYGNYTRWRDHRWNEEVWRLEYASVDFNGEMRKTGFDVVDEGPPAWRSRYNVLGTKPS